MANSAALAGTLLNVLSLVEAGFNLKAIVDTARGMEAEGKSDEEISAWLKDVRESALKELNELK